MTADVAHEADRVDRDKRGRAKRRLLLAAKLLVALLLFGWLVASGRLDLTLLFRRSDPGSHVIGVLLVLVSVVLQYVRWWLLLRAQDVGLSLRDAFEISFIAQFLSAVMPGASASEVVRAYYVGRAVSGGALRGSVSVVVDRAIGLLVLLWFGVVGFVTIYGAGATGMTESRRTFEVVIMLALAGSIAMTFVGFAKTRALLLPLVPRRWRGGFDEAVSMLAADRRTLAASLALSVAATSCVMLAFVAAGRAAGSGADLITVCAVTPVVFVASVLPISPAGLGVAEATASITFGQFGVVEGATMMAFFRIWNLVAFVPGAYFYVVRSRKSEATPSLERGDLDGPNESARGRSGPTAR